MNAKQLLADGEITMSQYLSITMRYTKPETTEVIGGARYSYEERLAIIKLGYSLFLMSKTHYVLTQGAKLADKLQLKAGALVDRLRNIFWLLSEGRFGRNNINHGVGWIEPMLIEYKQSTKSSNIEKQTHYIFGEA